MTTSSRPRTIIRCFGICVALAIAVGIVALTVHEVRITRDRPSIAEIEAEIAAALPVGSSEAEINAYLDLKGWPHGTETVSAEASMLDTYMVRAGITAGTRIIIAGVDHDGSLVWLSARLVTVILVVDERRALVRMEIFSHNVT